MVRPAAKREAVAHLRERFEMSERRACAVIVADRKMIRYRSRRPPETALRTRLRELANERRRFGYRRLFILLRREGEPSGINRIYRLHRVRKVWLCASARPAGVPSGHEPRSWSRHGPMPAGRWTLSTISSPTAPLPGAQYRR